MCITRTLPEVYQLNSKCTLILKYSSDVAYTWCKCKLHIQYTDTIHIMHKGGLRVTM